MGGRRSLLPHAVVTTDPNQRRAGAGGAVRTYGTFGYGTLAAPPAWRGALDTPSSSRSGHSEAPSQAGVTHIHVVRYTGCCTEACGCTCTDWLTSTSHNRGA